jgi:serine protease Do
MNSELQALASRVAPSVVKIEVAGLNSIHDPTSASTSYVTKENTVGSGIVIDSAGLILTNAHVVEHAISIEVTIYNHPDERSPTGNDVRRYQAQVLGRDVLTDIALLKVDAQGLTALKLADSDSVHVGQLGLAFGSPLGLENTLTMGVISSTQRQLDMNSPVVYLQTDASINPGNSGGPLVNISGEVIGMNTLIASQSGGNEGVGFSIPSNTLGFVYNQLRTIGHVRRGELGIVATQISPELAAGLGLPNKPGVILDDVLPGSPAEASGLHPGDVLLAVDDKAIEDPQQLSVLLFRKHIGDQVRMKVQGPDMEVKVVDLTIARRPRNPEDIFDLTHLATNIIPRLGIIVVPLSPTMSVLIPPTRMPSGLFIVAVTSATHGVTPDLQTGDVLYTLNRKPIDSIATLRTLLAQLPADAPVALQIERDGKLQFVAFANPE